MKAIVVYESLWGNTAAIAHAIAEGIGPEAVALSTAQASAQAITEADLLVVGSPVLGFSVPSDQMLKSIEMNRAKETTPPDVSQPSMGAWLQALPKGSGRATSFETRIWWSPGGATKGILRGLEKAGYLKLVEPKRFIVEGKYGPLRDGEVEKAKAWGAEIAQAIK